MSSIIVTAGYHTGRTAPNRGRTFPPEVLTEDEVKSLIRSCSNRAPTGIRNRALITVMYRAGLRLSEALALKPKDIDPETGTVTVLHGKGDKRRVVGLDPGSMAILLQWSDKRHQYGLTGRSSLFCTLQGRPPFTRPMFGRCCTVWGPRLVSRNEFIRMDLGTPWRSI